MLNPKHVDIVFDLARESAADGGFSLVVAGDCMRPALANGEVVTVRRAKLYIPGDIVAFRTDQSLVVHRLLGWAPAAGGGVGLVTRGDHCDRHDGIVPAARVIGRVATRVSVRDRARAAAAFAAIAFRKVFRTA